MRFNRQLTADYRKPRGFSYAEVLLSISLIVILIVPAMQALNSAIRGGANCLAERQFLLRNKMEEELSKPFGEIDAATPTSTSSTATITDSNITDSCGTSAKRTIVLQRLSADLIAVTVYFETEGSSNGLKTLVGRWW